NADFDGDQMAVHLPLSIEAQVEAMTLMMSTNNIFSPSNGSPIISPTQDIVMGSYYLTVHRRGERGEYKKNNGVETGVYSSSNEVFLAFSQGKVDIHARIKMRLPSHKKLKGEGEKEFTPGMVITTTVGRVTFNDILHPKMPYYNLALGQKQLQSIIADCYQLLGRRETINLLDDMKDIGFRESTRSGLSFATDDLKTPATKDLILAEAEKEVAKTQRLYQRGIITDLERYNKVLDAWTRAREQITNRMMLELKEDTRGGEDYLNPIFLMAESGARGGVEQIRQLAGMRGLMAKPSGKIIETPIKANFREGLSVLEYFSSTHGARKGLADTALKTADSGYLTRKLADVAQNVVITNEDCGTSQGIVKGVIYKGEKVEVSLSQSIRGRVSRVNIINPITDEVVVRENEMITFDAARKLEEMQIEKIQVRSPMTCETTLGICRRCYGMDLSTGQLVEQGMAVGIIAAQSIGEPGTQLTMRTFHIGGTAIRGMEEKDVKSKREGVAKYVGINLVTNDEGLKIALSRNGEIQILDPKGRELEKFDVPDGAAMLVEDGQHVAKGAMLCEWDPHNIPILAEVGGTIRYEDIVENETMRIEIDPSGHTRRTIIEHKGDLHPQIIVADGEGKTLAFYYIPERAGIEVGEGQRVTAGSLLAKTPREVGGTQDITGGLPRVTELFEARRPKEPAVIAEIDGRVDLLEEKRRGKRTIIVKNESGIEREHLVPHGKHLRVQGGGRVRAGDALVEGPLVPHDILRISGEEAVQRYLLREIQNVYRSQRVEIDDKHLEIIVAQMLRKVRVDSVGDTGLLPGSVIDKFEFRGKNLELMTCVKIKDPGDTDFRQGDIVPRDHFDAENLRVEEANAKKAEWLRPKPAAASTQLLGITKAAVQSDSFISAASFQETTKVLTEAALAGKSDYLVGLKENVILGHLVPAGTGFKMHQDAEVRIRPEALEALAEKGPGYARYPREEVVTPTVKAD
ncbi:MAG: DNA-directed RNA polymerase subunit beta', partial [Isosphaeraceae bacterium]